MNEFLKNIKLFAFDLDGTLYIGNNLVKGAVELIGLLRNNYQVVFFTNNSTKTSAQICEKLNKLGIECKLNEVYTSSSSTVLYLKEKNIDNIYLICSRDFQKEIERNGIKLSPADKSENLVVGLDFDFNYNKIAAALKILNNGGNFIVCNNDRSFPVEGNVNMPGCGAMVGAIVEAANKKPDFIVGKPATYILKKISEDFAVANEDIIVVGDSYESDIMMALNFKCKSIIVNGQKIDNENVIAKKIDEIIKLIKEV